jgi:hypothetical protein
MSPAFCFMVAKKRLGAVAPANPLFDFAPMECAIRVPLNKSPAGALLEKPGYHDAHFLRDA